MCKWLCVIANNICASFENRSFFAPTALLITVMSVVVKESVLTVWHTVYTCLYEVLMVHHNGCLEKGEC